MYKLISILVLLPFFGFPQARVSSEFIDSIVNVSMSKFPQAGIGVAVIQDGKVTHMKGYGITAAESGAQVDENTLFAIASNSKAFTTTALGILADQGKLSWTDKVIDHIPEFRMYDPWVTENFIIADLLTHRSGLGLGAGDLMFFPDGADFTVDDVIRSFQYQTPVSDFRTKYDYDNLLYVVAGEVVKRACGKSWDQFVEDEIMDKLGMENSVGIFQNITNNTNIAYPHKTENGHIQQIDTYTKSDGSLGAAGGIYSSVNDMSKWVLMHLNEGLYGDMLADTLISKKNHQELWKIYTNIGYNAFGGGIYNNHYRGYGLGFNLRDENGYTIVQHSGGLPGMLSMVTMIPELKAGIIILTNTDPGGLSILTLTNEIKDEIIGAKGLDWFEWAASRLNKRESEVDSVVNAVWAQVEKVKPTKLDFKQYVGRYKDDWFGEVVIYQKEDHLWIKSLRSPKLKGLMHYYKANSFAVAWDYRDMDCDAFAIFQLDENGKATSISMKGISPDIDFSFDFQDLDLRKIPEKLFEFGF
ncbi:MAG: serine hydrolase [Lewinellaceae bacterium]|nr:serine hydrolase [Lewinellaceae bacterium]